MMCGRYYKLYGVVTCFFSSLEKSNVGEGYSVSYMITYSLTATLNLSFRRSINLSVSLRESVGALLRWTSCLFELCEYIDRESVNSNIRTCLVKSVSSLEVD